MTPAGTAQPVQPSYQSCWPRQLVVTGSSVSFEGVYAALNLLLPRRQAAGGWPRDSAGQYRCNGKVSWESGETRLPAAGGGCCRIGPFGAAFTARGESLGPPMHGWIHVHHSLTPAILPCSLAVVYSCRSLAGAETLQNRTGDLRSSYSFGSFVLRETVFWVSLEEQAAFQRRWLTQTRYENKAWRG